MFHRARTLSCLTAAVILVFLPNGSEAAADHNPATDHLVRIIPYNGMLELDGKPITGNIDMRFTLYDEAGNSLWQEEWSAGGNGAVACMSGRFTVSLGKFTDITNTIFDAERLFLGIEVKNESGEWVALQGRQEIHPVPYSLWSAQSSNLKVAGDLDVAGKASVGGDLSVGHFVKIGGSDIELGLNDGRTHDAARARALVHYEDANISDALVVNFDGDFSGGTMVVGPENDGKKAALIIRRPNTDSDLLIDNNEIATTSGALFLNKDSGDEIRAYKDLVILANIDLGIVDKTCTDTQTCECDEGTALLTYFFACPSSSSNLVEWTKPYDNGVQVRCLNHDPARITIRCAKIK
ncbi:MAG: hypothetical protein GXP49_14415 [Deltaproteobacteria bacterium]|nr:hypothetical protein [Deltaproteobacteria bacterium]